MFKCFGSIFSLGAPELWGFYLGLGAGISLAWAIGHLNPCHLKSNTLTLSGKLKYQGSFYFYSPALFKIVRAKILFLYAAAIYSKKIIHVLIDLFSHSAKCLQLGLINS